MSAVAQWEREEIAKYLDGKETWDQMFGHADKALQAILDQPRPV